MLQYILNCTAIWLLSLISYDAFLRRTVLHAYNRIYLLGTFLAGIFIPAFSLVRQAHFPPQLRNEYGLEKTYELKSNIVAAAQLNNQHETTWQQYLWMIYLTGVLVSLFLLVREAVNIMRLYNRGKKTTMEGLWVIETEKDHSPFSFFGFIFIGKSSAYTQEQLSMILTHEKCHNAQWHGLDVLLLQLGKIIFWFHPLPYLFAQRLCMVHEYQADRSIRQPLNEYGSFLLEQTIFSHTPSIAHSFYHSPIKKRIVMLTRKSSTRSKSKGLIAIPVIAVSLLCFSKDAFSDNKRKIDGNNVTYKGNTFELYSAAPDTIFMENPVTGKMQMKIGKMTPYPFKMNKAPLLSNDAVDKRAQLKGPSDNMILAGLNKNKSLFDKLQDGDYEISVSQIVVGTEGQVLYYVFDGIKNTVTRPVAGSKTDWENIPVEPQNIKDQLNTMIESIADNLKYEPAMKDGHTVNSYTGMSAGEEVFIVVKGHNAQIQTREEYNKKLYDSYDKNKQGKSTIMFTK